MIYERIASSCGFELSFTVYKDLEGVLSLVIYRPNPYYGSPAFTPLHIFRDIKNPFSPDLMFNPMNKDYSRQWLKSNTVVTHRGSSHTGPNMIQPYLGNSIYSFELVVGTLNSIAEIRHNLDIAPKSMQGYYGDDNAIWMWDL